MRPKVGIVVLNYNNYADTKACLESLFTCLYPNIKIIVVDNASPDGSGSMLSQEYAGRIEYLAASVNLGFASGNNLGISRAVELGCQYIGLLNNDTVVAPGFLDPVIDVLEADSGTGAAGGKILYYTPPNRIWFAGSKRGWRGITHRGKDQVDRAQFGALNDVPFLTGCYFVTRKEIIEKYGMLDESYFMGLEDHEFSFRIKRLGYKLAYVPNSVVWHKVGRSRKNITVGQVYQGYLAQLIFSHNIRSAFNWRFYHAAFPIWAFGYSMPRIAIQTGLPIVALTKAVFTAWKESLYRLKTTSEDWTKKF